MIIIYILVFCLLLRASILTSLALWWNHNTPNLPERKELEQNSTGYNVYKNGKQVGTLIGSYHLQLNYTEQEALTQYFKKQLEKHHTVFTEIPLAHLANSGGVEDTLYRAVSTNTNITLNHFEPLSQQQAFLTRSIIIFNGIKHLNSTYQWIHKRPKLAKILHQQILSITPLLNTIYNLFTDNAHTKFVAEHQQKGLSRKTENFKAYQRGTALPLTAEEGYMFCMDERDILYSNKLLAAEDGWLTVVGVSHLAGTNSIVDYLIQAGYELQGFNAYQEATSSL